MKLSMFVWAILPVSLYATPITGNLSAYAVLETSDSSGKHYSPNPDDEQTFQDMQQATKFVFYADGEISNFKGSGDYGGITNSQGAFLVHYPYYFDYSDFKQTKDFWTLALYGPDSNIPVIFSFDVTSFHSEFTQDTMTLWGDGIAHMTGKRDTYANWIISAGPDYDPYYYGPVAGASFTATGVAVPENAGTLVLSLAGFAITCAAFKWRRFRKDHITQTDAPFSRTQPTDADMGMSNGAPDQ